MNGKQGVLELDSIESQQDFWQGVVSSGPILLGVIPFGITCGVMGLTAGLTSLETIMMSFLVFAGGSQFIALTMLGAGITGMGLIVFTTLLVNLRHVLMGASLAQYMVNQSISRQVLLSFLLTDEAYAMTISRIHQSGYSTAYQFGVSISLYITWVLATIIGVFIGSYIPDPLAWGLDFAMPATFLVLLFPRLTDKISLAVCAVAGLISIGGVLYLPGKWYMIAACIGAVLVGVLMEGDKKVRNEMMVIILGMALVTFATRFSSLALLQKTGMPAWLERWLKHIPTAILTALIIPALVMPKGQIDLSIHNHYLMAGLIAALVAYKSRNIIATLLLGMGAMFFLRLM